MSRPRHVCAVVSGLFLALAVARGQSAFPDQNSISSISGQFVVSSVAGDTPFSRNVFPAAGTNLVRLEPSLLAVAAERFKIFLWQQLGMKSDASWSGKIYLVLHPARSLDETVTITSTPFLDHWNYRVELPDVLVNTRYARALSAVLLLEIANRTTPPDGRSAEIPAWLVDGLAQQVLTADGENAVLSAPAKTDDGLPVGRLVEAKKDFDPLAAARQALLDLPVLTFDQLAWPTAAQTDGADGGAYFASAQVFLHELLELPDGPAKMRGLLAALPAHFNWQTAFYQAFHDNFKQPLDVEKWWALRVVNFSARAPGPRWTTDVSRDRLTELLSVPVELRRDASALPTHAEISLQAAIQNLPPAERDRVVRTKLRDLELIELRLAPPFGEWPTATATPWPTFSANKKIPRPFPSRTSMARR